MTVFRLKNLTVFVLISSGKTKKDFKCMWDFIKKMFITRLDIDIVS